MNDAVGNAGFESLYDIDGNVIEERALDAKSEPTLVKAGFYRKISLYDQWGRITEQKFFNLSDEPVGETAETGAHRVVWEYDDHGNVTSIKLYDKAGKPKVAGENLWALPPTSNG